jgi:hypothetical protein
MIIEREEKRKRDETTYRGFKRREEKMKRKRKRRI